jgi:phosphate butyryltransferase
MISKLSDLLVLARGSNKKIAVAGGADEIVLRAARDAIDAEAAEFILYGDYEATQKLIDEIDIDTGYEIVHCSDNEQCVRSAVSSVAEGAASLLMKGSVKTGELMGIFLEEQYALRTGYTMNLVSVFEIADFDRLLVISDAGMVPAPTLEQKVHSIANSVEVSRALGNETPRVAMIGAVETVSTKMQATTDAAIISKMSERKQIRGAVVDGPLALDNAVSEDAARRKGIKGPVAGKADVLIMPDIEAGNVFYKAMVFLAQAGVASAIVGGKVPIILTSRADSEETRLHSIALGVILAKENSK